MKRGSRTILHVDLDAFFAAVEVRENASLKGRPVIVGADPRGGKGRGVVAAASYEARAAGVHSAMPISQAYARCPEGVYLRPRLAAYSAASRQFMSILARYTDLVEPLSIDEAFLDVTGSRGLFGDGQTIARRIKNEVQEEAGLTASIGVAPSKFIAKIASDLEKPDGLVVVSPENVDSFLADLPIGRLWGAGSKAQKQFKRLGIATVGDVRCFSLEQLAVVFGNAMARHFFDLSRGVDLRQVVPEHERKSIGREVTFDTDVTSRSKVEQALLGLVEEVSHRLRASDLTGRTVAVKLRTENFATVTRRETLPVAVDTTDALWPVARELLRKADVTRQAIRLVGVAVSHFSKDAQLSLFDDGQARRERKLAGAMDAVRERFGADAIRRGALLELRREGRPRGRNTGDPGARRRR